MKSFNITGICNPKKHYMVDISRRLKAIEAMVDNGDYFTINRARQYGKTTTICELTDYLADKYLILSLDFQTISEQGFKSEQAFIQAFCRNVISKSENVEIPNEILSAFNDYASRKEHLILFDELFFTLQRWCRISEKPIVMIIDEVDSATNNQVFLDFLAQLRAGFLEREKNGAATFQSVILAGVTDVKHIKSKIRDEDQHKVNSPWNIAVDFKLDMSLSFDGICGMLEEYDIDHHTGMNITDVARAI